MAIETSALLLALANFLGATVQNEVFPVTAVGTKAWRSFDHHGQKLWLLVAFLIEFFSNDNRTRGKRSRR